MPTSYEIRARVDGNNKKQSLADLKLRRLNELNDRLKEDLERPRITIFEASMRSVLGSPAACNDTVAPRQQNFSVEN